MIGQSAENGSPSKKRFEGFEAVTQSGRVNADALGYAGVNSYEHAGLSLIVCSWFTID